MRGYSVLLQALAIWHRISDDRPIPITLHTLFLPTLVWRALTGRANQNARSNSPAGELTGELTRGPEKNLTKKKILSLQSSLVETLGTAGHSFGLFDPPRAS